MSHEELLKQLWILNPKKQGLLGTLYTCLKRYREVRFSSIRESPSNHEGCPTTKWATSKSSYFHYSGRVMCGAGFYKDLVWVKARTESLLLRLCVFKDQLTLKIICKVKCYQLFILIHKVIKRIKVHFTTKKEREGKIFRIKGKSFN